MMRARFLIHGALLAALVGLAGACARANEGAESGASSSLDEVEDRLLLVRSNHWSPLVIELIGEGVRRRVGTVERMQPRTFRLPAHLLASGKYVSLDAREEGSATGYTTALFILGPGDAVGLQLEHSLTMSTFRITRR